MADEDTATSKSRFSFNPLIVLVLLLIVGMGAYLFLPSASKKMQQKTGTNDTTVGGQQKPPKSLFFPSLDPESQKGQLVAEYSVLYKLSGHVTSIKASSTKDLYDITFTSTNGSQTYDAAGVGGTGILENSTGKEIAWTELKPGDEVIVNISVVSAQGSPKTFVNQIKTIYK